MNVSREKQVDIYGFGQLALLPCRLGLCLYGQYRGKVTLYINAQISKWVNGNGPDRSIIPVPN
jgi:hypothetical protein